MININIIKNRNNLISAVPKGRNILEIYKKGDTSDECLIYEIYNPKTNSIEEIGKDIHITPLVEIQDAIWESEDFYFAGISDPKSREYRIDIYKYISKTRTYDVIFSFDEEGRLSERGKRIKVFILSPVSILIQKEIPDATKKDNRMGHISFYQKIINLETGEENDIRDENLNNNGLCSIIAISPVQIMTKTGFNYLEDSRLKKGSENDALLEAVSIHTTSRFIADLSLGAANIDAMLITSAYFSSYILQPQFTGNYVYFSVFDPSAQNSLSVFYNVITSEQLTCRNEIPDPDDLNNNFVLDDSPYVKNSAMIETRFLNLKTMEFDISAMDREFVGITGNMIILKKINSKKGTVLEFYHYPDMKKLLEEKGSFVTGCKKDENYFIYIH